MSRHVLAALVAVVVMSVASVASGNSANTTCTLTEITKTKSSFLFHATLVRAKMSVSWCRDGRKITSAQVICTIEEFDGATITVNPCQPQGAYVVWRGQARGSFHALTSVIYSNCVFKYGCWAEAVLNIDRWIYPDGVVTQRQRGS